MPKTITNATVIGQRVLNATTKLIEVYAPEIAKTAVPGPIRECAGRKNTAPLLRRPFGVAGVNADNGTFIMIYRIIGEATHILAEVCSGDKLSIVGPLGHGFAMEAERPLLVGGGRGLAPLLYLAEGFCAQNKPIEILREGVRKKNCFGQICTKIFAKISHITTDDGSCGVQGTVIALLPQLLDSGKYDCVYVCGPVPMMKAVAEVAAEKNIKCQVSLEKYMACGLGACLSCSCSGIGKRLKVCTDGPVFWAEEVGEW